jgi:hypothetical protein
VPELSPAPPDDGGVAVGRQRDGIALAGSNRAAANQLGALLGPDTAAPGPDPRRSVVAERPSHDGGLPSVDNATD